MFWLKGCLECLRTKILIIVGMACLICLLIAVSVARYFNERSLRAGIVDKSRAIHSRLNASTQFIANQGGLKPAIERFTNRYKSHSQMSEQDKLDVLKQVPIFAAMKIGKEGSEKDHYTFRVFSDEPRRKENLATAEELKVFKAFEADPKLDEIVNDNGRFIAVYSPVRLQAAQGCLNCHGDPKTSPWQDGKDILGFGMENWKDGKLHGVFVLSTDVDEVKAIQARSEFASTDLQIGVFIGIGALLALFVASLMIRAPLRRMKNVSDRLVSDSAEVGAAVSQIFAVSQDLSTASAQQGASVQETMASIEEIKAMVQTTASSAGESEQASAQSKSSAEKGRAIVAEMVNSMKAINDSNDSVSAAVNAGNLKISEIVEVIRQIGAKTKVINDIVFQTKLLSFNASVEAARAGEHGKGFAVVAEEVGNLAAMSGHAAKEISELLDDSIGKVEDIVQETKVTVEQLMGSAQTNVSGGMQIAKRCEEMLGEIVGSSTSVSNMIGSIASASGEQSKGINEISKAMVQIDQSAQVGSTSAENCATAAEQLSIKVKDLRAASAALRLVIDGQKTVNKFKWGEEYRLGVAAMDGEHQVLIEKMNALATLFEGRRSRRIHEVEKLFKDLASFTIEHFSHEEDYMESVGYPDLDAHRQIHATLLERVREFGRQIEDGEVDGGELMEFLNDWLMRHILSVDMKYSRHVKKERAAA